MVLVMGALVLLLGGCALLPGASTAPTSSVAATSTPSAPASSPVASAPSTASAQATTPAASPVVPTPSGPRPSAKSRAYAKHIGGTSHVGEDLVFIIGDSVSTEQEARALLNRAIPRFGDMQSYFIIQRSDNFDGMRPGWWIVIEAYRKQPSTENLQFAKRGFVGAYVKRATVRTADPIPVYEDLVRK